MNRMSKRKLLGLILATVVLFIATVPVQAFPPGPMRGPWSRQAFQRELLRIGGDNLVAYWPLDDQSGTTARDIGPNAEVLDITGTTLGQDGPPALGRSHYFDGINDVDSQHVYEDETGASWGPTVHGLSLADGVAFIRTEGVDLSPFAGVAGSDTPYMIVLTDDAGSKVAWGYVGAQEAAEALATTGGPLNDGELLGNPGFETAGAGDPDFFANWSEDAGGGTVADEGVLVHSGSHAAKFTGDTTFGFRPRLVGGVTVVPGKTYKITFWTRGDGANAGAWSLYDDTNAIPIHDLMGTGVAGTAYTQVAVYFTAPADCVLASLSLISANVNGALTYFDDISLKEVLHPGTDAVHIVSTRDGSTRNWAGIEAGFDYNDSAYTFEIRKSLFQQTGAITVGAWAKPAAASLAESEYFIAKRASADLSWALYRNTSEQYSTFVSLSGASTASSIVGTSHVDTDWRFVVFTFEPSVALILYVNGSAEASDTIGIPASLFDSSAPLTVGDYSELVRTWQGNIAHAFVISAALDSRSIRRLYEIGSRAHSG